MGSVASKSGDFEELVFKLNLIICHHAQKPKACRPETAKVIRECVINAVNGFGRLEVGRLRRAEFRNYNFKPLRQLRKLSYDA